MSEFKILLGNSKEKLKEIPDNSVDCCITSPPYYGLRDYGTGKWVGGDPNCPHRRLSKCSDKTITGHAQEELKGNVGDAIYKTVCPLCGAVREDSQIGLEETPEAYVASLMEVFEEVRRVLKPTGTFWLNIGDSYWGSGSRGWDFTNKFSDASKIQEGSKGTTNLQNIPKLTGKTETGIKNKDLVGIPWMLAFACRKNGWYLRQEIIWHKPQPMPESVKDRCVRSHESIFLMAKKPNYYFDYKTIQEKALSDEGSAPDGMKNKRDVWSVNTDHFEGAHFATFPPKLIEPMVLAGCPRGGANSRSLHGEWNNGCRSVA